MLRLLLAALLVLLQVHHGLANPIQNQCLDERTLRDVLSLQKPGVEIVSLAGVEANLFVSGFNLIPPLSNIIADGVLVVSLHKGEQVALAFFRNGCMTARGLMPRARADQLLLQIERSGA